MIKAIETTIYVMKIKKDKNIKIICCYPLKPETSDRKEIYVFKHR